MVKVTCLVTSLVLLAMPMAWAEENPITLSIEKSHLRGSHANGAKVFVANNVDFALCFRPRLDDDTNLSGEFIAENIRLEPGKERLLIGEFSAISINEGWSIQISGELNADCL